MQQSKQNKSLANTSRNQETNKTNSLSVCLSICLSVYLPISLSLSIPHSFHPSLLTVYHIMQAGSGLLCSEDDLEFPILPFYLLCAGIAGVDHMVLRT